MPKPPRLDRPRRRDPGLLNWWILASRAREGSARDTRRRRISPFRDYQIGDGSGLLRGQVVILQSHPGSIDRGVRTLRRALSPTFRAGSDAAHHPLAGVGAADSGAVLLDRREPPMFLFRSPSGLAGPAAHET